MPQQHLAIDPTDYANIVAAGFDPPRPAMEPFTLIPFHSWIEHPDHGMVPTYGPTEENANVVITIPVINDPLPSDELQLRSIQYYAYVLPLQSWLPDMQTVPMRVIWQDRLQGLIDSDLWMAENELVLQAYHVADIFETLKEYSLEKWSNAITADMEYEIFSRVNPAGRDVADQALPFSDILDKLWLLYSQAGGWVTITNDEPSYVTQEEWMVLYNAHSP